MNYYAVAISEVLKAIKRGEETDLLFKILQFQPAAIVKATEAKDGLEKEG